MPSTLAADRVLAAAPNPWFGTTYLTENTEEVLTALREHLVITALAVLFGLLLSVPLALAARRSRVLESAILGTAGVVYAIPSISLLLVLYDVVGLGLSVTTVVVALSLYNMLILVRNVLTGLRGVPAETRDAAAGLGYGRIRRVLAVDLPLALPSIVAGLRIATVNTVALVTIGFAVGHGGLGALLTQGYKNNLYREQVMTGLVLIVLLAFALDLLLVLAQRLLMPWRRVAAR